MPNRTFIPLQRFPNLRPFIRFCIDTALVGGHLRGTLAFLFFLGRSNSVPVPPSWRERGFNLRAVEQSRHKKKPDRHVRQKRKQNNSEGDFIHFLREGEVQHPPLPIELRWAFSLAFITNHTGHHYSISLAWSACRKCQAILSFRRFVFSFKVLERSFKAFR